MTSEYVVIVNTYLTDRVWWKPRTWRRKTYEYRELLGIHEYGDILYEYDRERYDREFLGGKRQETEQS